MKRSWLTFAFVAALSACQESPTLLAPDIVIDFGCPTNPPAERVMTFLSMHGFTSLDLEAARRKKGDTFFPLQIDAFDRRRIMIEVIGLKKPRSYGSGVDYRLTITSPPPTRHDQALESDAVQFVRGTLRCQVHDVGRFDNDVNAVKLFDSVLADVQRRMRVARAP